MENKIDKNYLLSRNVPNRKWYANQERAKATSKEAVLFHQLG